MQLHMHVSDQLSVPKAEPVVSTSAVADPVPLSSTLDASSLVEAPSSAATVQDANADGLPGIHDFQQSVPVFHGGFMVHVCLRYGCCMHILACFACDVQARLAHIHVTGWTCAEPYRVLR